jgi:hypothetical protein
VCHFPFFGRKRPIFPQREIFPLLPSAQRLTAVPLGRHKITIKDKALKTNKMDLGQPFSKHSNQPLVMLAINCPERVGSVQFRHSSRKRKNTNFGKTKDNFFEKYANFF